MGIYQAYFCPLLRVFDSGQVRTREGKFGEEDRIFEFRKLL